MYKVFFVLQSKRKGLSVDEKRHRMMEFFFEKVCLNNLNVISNQIKCCCLIRLKIITLKCLCDVVLNLRLQYKGIFNLVGNAAKCLRGNLLVGGNCIEIILGDVVFIWLQLYNKKGPD